MTHQVRRRTLPVAIAMVGLLFGALLNAPTATAARAPELVRSTPTASSTPYAAPTRVVLRFDRPIRADAVRVTVRDRSGRYWHRGLPRVVGNTVTQGSSLYAGEGRYDVRYRVRAVDGRWITGSFHYRVKAV